MKTPFLGAFMAEFQCDSLVRPRLGARRALAAEASVGDANGSEYGNAFTGRGMQ